MPTAFTFEKSLNRILALDWVVAWPPRRSQKLLIKAYLYRSALWTKSLPKDDNWPFLNIAAQVVPAVRPPEDSMHYLRTHLAQSSFYCQSPGDPAEFGAQLPMVVQQTCLWYVHWSAIQDIAEIVARDLPHPYEPLIQFYERQGLLYEPESNWFNCTVGGFSRNEMLG